MKIFTAQDDINKFYGTFSRNKRNIIIQEKDQKAILSSVSGYNK